MAALSIPGSAQAEITAAPDGSPRAQGGPALEGTPWALRFLPGPAGRLQPVEWGTEVTAQFQNGQLSGNAGCNHYTAVYLAPQQDALVISGLNTIRDVCATGQVFAQENTFLAALQQVGRFSVDQGGHLLLRDRLDQPLLVFGLQPAVTLEGTEWLADGYANDFGAIVPVTRGAEITATFSGGLLNGSSGCNSYTGTYTLNGELITIELGASTLRACDSPPGVMEQEAGYLSALPLARTYEISGDRLALLDERLQRVVTCIARRAA